MSRITADLIRKKAEHHDGLLPDLEELSLHQLEIERIEVVGSLCRKIRILYLQNNIIPRIENLQHMKQLEYLNLALNNITRIEGLSSCEFLHKLDLTVNFIDVDALEDSVDHLAGLLHMRELFLMGNPCLEWPGARPFIVASLPQLKQLDGKEVTRSERIHAAKQLLQLRGELRALAAAKQAAKGGPAAPATGPGGAAAPADGDEDDGDASATEAWTPEARVRMYREAAARKAEQEKGRRGAEPARRDRDREHAAAVAAVRQAEGEGHVRQRNEGRWEFSLEDEDGAGSAVLRLQLSRFLDTSLIDVDVHPLYISIVIKGKVFRLSLPEEVRPGAAQSKRSQTTGELAVTMPKVAPSDTLRGMRRADRAAAAAAGAGTGGGVAARKAAHPAATTRFGAATKLGDEMLEAATAAASSSPSGKAVRLVSAGQAGAFPDSTSIPDGQGGMMLFRAAETRAAAAPGDDFVVVAAAPGAAAATAAPLGGDDEVPPLI